MNVFLFGLGGAGSAPSGDAASAALEALAARGPFPSRVHAWTAPSGRAVLAWAAHPPEDVGGVRHVHGEEGRVALFAGRPIRWLAGDRADGRSPLDPAAYLEPAAGWARGLDGRFAALRYDDRGAAAEVVTDPLGAYPVFAAEGSGVRWISNSADALRDLVGTRDLDPVALAGLLGGGWPLDGHPVWAGVRRLERAAVHRFAAGAEPEREELLPAARIARMPGAGFEPEAAAVTLVAATRALADWPGRPSVVPVTGGRDSRLVLAAALAAGLEVTTITGGSPDAPDVRLGRLLATTAGLPHGLIEADPAGDPWSAPERAAAVLAATTAGTASLADAAGFPLSAREGPLPLWHSGQGGEIARGYYGAPRRTGRDPTVAWLLRAYLGRRAGRAEVIGAEAVALVRGRVAAFADAQLAAGAAVGDLPDLFYLLRRMATWAAPTHGAVEPVRDAVSPLWCAAMLPHMLGASRGDRAREVFHLRVLEVLAPQLVDLPFEGDRRWPARESAAAGRLRRARTVTVKAAAEARRRVQGARRSPARSAGAPAVPQPAPSVAADPFSPVLARVRTAASAQPGHPAWPVLDRSRVEALLARDAAALDTMSRYYVWRLATVLLPEVYAASSLGPPRDLPPAA